MALGAMVLGVPAAAGQRNAHGLALLEALGKECLDGLKSRLVQCLALGKPVWHLSEAARGDGPVHRLEIVTAARGLTLRSEERRVGKEWRLRWVACGSNKNRRRSCRR